MRRLRALLARLIPVAMLASMLAVVGGTPANADSIPATNWTPVSIGTVLPGASDVMTDASGGVTVGCPQSSSSTMFQSFDSSGTKVQDQPKPSGYSGSFCPGDAGNSTVGKDGTVYLGMSSGSSQYIQAWKNNGLVWTYAIPCGSNGYPWTMTMGADDNLYVVISQGGGSCYGWQLIGLTPTAQSGTSPAAPQEVMNHRIYAGSVYGQGLAAYNNGLVLYTSGGIQYAPYTGTWPDAITPSGPLLTSQIGMVNRWFEASTNGRVFVVNKANSGQSTGCTDPNNDVGSIMAIGPSGTIWTTSLLTACVYLHEVHPTSAGGFVMRYSYVPATGGNTVEKVAAFDSAGNMLWSNQIDGAVSPGTIVSSVDLNGDVALRYNTAGSQQINGTTYRFPQISFRMLSGFTGETISSAQFTLRGDSSTTSGPSYMWGSGGELAMAKNTVYVAAYQCTTLYNGCNMSQTTLYAFTVPGVQMDYPRGAIFGVGGQSQNYVAMGDSFSAGQGVPPFVSPSDTDGCNRSSQAYPYLLLSSAMHPLTLGNFVACSGAQTSNVINGQNGEPPQINALATDTHAVTITIGGNDIGFAQFVMACVFQDCSSSTVSQPFFDKVNNLGSVLSTTYNTILTQAPNANVYVVGYPQVIPDPSVCSNALGSWLAAFNTLVGSAHNGDQSAVDVVMAIGHLAAVADTLINALITAGQVTFTSAEMSTARNLTAALDSKISATVGAVVNSRLKYVDAIATGTPFAGHELCTVDPYFNGLDTINRDYSFHPNQEGQDAYRRLLQSQF
jgi:hypothetical protein